VRIKTCIWAAEVRRILKRRRHKFNVNRKSHFKLSVMATVFSTGQMVLTMKDTGVITKQKDKGHSGMPKAMYIEVISGTIWPTGTESTLILTDLNIKVNLEMMCRKATVKKNGLMVPNTSEAIRMA
jgi:hypothetical protein